MARRSVLQRATRLAKKTHKSFQRILKNQQKKSVEKVRSIVGNDIVDELRPEEDKMSKFYHHSSLAAKYLLGTWEYQLKQFQGEYKHFKKAMKEPADQPLSLYAPWLYLVPAAIALGIFAKCLGRNSWSGYKFEDINLQRKDLVTFYNEIGITFDESKQLPPSQDFTTEYPADQL